MKEDEEILRQAKLIKAIIVELDTELGKNSYPDSLTVALHNWVNKWAMSHKITNDRQKQPYTAQTGGGEWSSIPATKPQLKAVKAIVYYHPEFLDKLPDDTDHLNKQQASDFITEYGGKGKGKPKGDGGKLDNYN